MNREEPKLINKAVKGIGYVGLWNDGKIGWCLPEFLSEYSAGEPVVQPYNKGERVYLCDITIKLRKDKLGRLKSKIIK